MRACYVLLEFPVLSQTFVVDEIDALRQQGHDVYTVSMQGGPGADLALGTLRARSPRVIGSALWLLLRRPSALGALLRGPLTFGLRMKLLHAAHEASRRHIEVVHAHFAYRSADGAEIIGRALGTGHSVTVHAHDIFVERTHSDRRLAAARTVITVCEYNRQWLEENHPRAVAGKLHVIPCSTRIDVSPAAPERSGKPVVLAVGRLVQKKGFDTLIRAVNLATSDFEVVIVGDGPERDHLSQLAADSTRTVVLAGALERVETAEWFRRAAVFCLPCRIAPDGDRDSMPLVVKEAMAVGLPVVASDAVGVPEMVVEGETGILVPPDDAAALAAAIDTVLRDPERARAMGARGREVVGERFDLRDQARRVAEVLA